MINTRALTQLLTDNTDGRAVLRWFIMTPNGSLLAYTCPADLRELRDQVALVSMVWKEQTAIKRAQLNGSLDDSAQDDKRNHANLVRNVTMEIENRNVLVRCLQPSLLLVLEGGVPPRRSKRFIVTAEGRGDPRYPDPSDTSAQTTDGRSPTSSVTSTTASTRGKRSKVLELHRTRLDAMGDALTRQFQRDGFEMPVESEDTFY